MLDPVEEGEEDEGENDDEDSCDDDGDADVGLGELADVVEAVGDATLEVESDI